MVGEESLAGAAVLALPEAGEGGRQGEVGGEVPGGFGGELLDLGVVRVPIAGGQEQCDDGDVPRVAGATFDLRDCPRIKVTPVRAPPSGAGEDWGRAIRVRRRPC